MYYRMSTTPTNFGEVKVDELVRVYNNYKQGLQKSQEKRKEWLQTDAGKEYNRERAAAYYNRNKETILEKRKEKYAAKKELRQLADRQMAQAQSVPLPLSSP